MSNLQFQDISTVQSSPQVVSTVLAATTIAPASFLTLVLGNTNIGTITPPVTGAHMLCLVFTGTPGQLLTTGNILLGSTTVATNVANILVYNPIAAKYHIVRGTAA